ncbi:MAG TPA: protein kinase [Gemmatimonadaceae bacterium]|nr:protein kinase [Gemmatimonadaceae bacterium]
MANASAEVAELLGDRYEVERVLGRGGMAVVHLAEERKHQRKVAIKVLRRELAASVGTERFLREIGIAARLSHPHIVPLIDSGKAGELLYYVSPYVPGGSLRDRLEREQRLVIDEAIRIAVEVGTGLDYAHRNGFVHRDVKPENILFADDHALLADFGIAHVCAGKGDQTLTEGGIAIGTPEYMSPEQASGDSGIGTPADIYALGCVVHEMIAGQPPFRGSTVVATMARHVTEKPRPLRSLRPETPVGVEQAVLRSLAKDPAMRFATVAEFTAALQQSKTETVRRSPAQTRSIAVLPFVNSSPDPDNEYLSDGLTDELIDALAKVEGLRVASRTSVFSLKGKPLDVRAIGALLDVSEVLEGTVRRSGQDLRITVQLTSTADGALRWSHRYDRKLDDVFAIQDEIAHTIVDTLRATSFANLTEPESDRGTENVQAYGLYLRGRYEWNRRTQDGVSAGIKYFEQAIEIDPNYALAYTGLADSYAIHVDYRNVPVHEGFERAKQYAKKALELDDELAEAHASLAWTLFIYDWDWYGAAAEFRRALELDPKYATAHQWYSFVLASQGRFEEALIEAHTAQELDPASVSVRRSLGYVYLYARRFDRGRYHLLRAIELNPTAEESYRVLGLLLTLGGQHDEAERVLREALELAGEGSTYTKVTLAYALARAGRNDYAVETLRELEAKRKGEYVSPVELATLHVALGNDKEALEWANRACDERRGWVAYLRVHPVLDPVRGHPLYDELLKRVKLDEWPTRRTL